MEGGRHRHPRAGPPFAHRGPVGNGQDHHRFVVGDGQDGPLDDVSVQCSGYVKVFRYFGNVIVGDRQTGQGQIAAGGKGGDGDGEGRIRRGKVGRFGAGADRERKFHHDGGVDGGGDGVRKSGSHHGVPGVAVLLRGGGIPETKGDFRIVVGDPQNGVQHRQCGVPDDHASALNEQGLRPRPFRNRVIAYLDGKLARPRGSPGGDGHPQGKARRGVGSGRVGGLEILPHRKSLAVIVEYRGAPRRLQPHCQPARRGDDPGRQLGGNPHRAASAVFGQGSQGIAAAVGQGEGDAAVQDGNFLRVGNLPSPHPGRPGHRHGFRIFHRPVREGGEAETPVGLDSPGGDGEREPVAEHARPGKGVIVVHPPGGRVGPAAGDRHRHQHGLGQEGVRPGK